MVYLFSQFLVIAFVTLIYVTLLLGLASARPASNAIAGLPSSNTTDSIIATYETVIPATLQLQWMSFEAPFHIYNYEYVHNVNLTVDNVYQGMLVYYARGIRKHCHDDGVWCVKHGDPTSPEMTIWYKGYEYQHTTWTVDCGEHCKLYNDEVEA
ncbi:hypothetical protein BG015_010872 [Linnemannia schmuckeri]|uniref:Uncharacterized protein n=1 Tax=Linnemannia schmuckeri TaxID=64567 RepID=A0A9P5V8T3_9FUNG|nr:hypothetical protein BG015_010872 [Linnemannia schmuckeri]